MGQCFDALGGNAAATNAAGVARKCNFYFCCDFSKRDSKDSFHESRG